ncbi:MAG: viologen exporter family transport system permease protein [Chloroflexota bacterium]|jgi:ABC-2 type transport system permease protein|nr:viologen exporter family transport system permease protein [Chloroflexota bacterium]
MKPRDPARLAAPAREPLRPLRLFGLFFRVGALNELQYRANFAIQVFQSVIALATGLAVIGLVFSQTTHLNDWTQPELLAVMGVHILMGGVIQTFIQPNMVRLMSDVREGTLDFVLTKPEDAQVLISIREVKIWQTIDVVIGLVVLGVGAAQVQAAVGPVQAIAFVVTLLLGASMIYCFWLILTVGAFWIVRMDEIHELFDGIYQSGRWPVTIYPGWLRVSLTFLVPIAFAVTVPAEAITSRLTIETVAGAAIFAVALFLFTRWWWRFGLRHYSGASA